MTPIDDRITDWLTRLEAELAGDDPALRHDALTDAREHLTAAQSELGDDADDAATEQLLADYGDPAEVADSYRSAELLLDSGPTRPASSPVATDNAAAATEPVTSPGWFGVVRDPNAWSAIVYMLLALPLGVAWFTWAVTGISLSLGLLILIVGIPIALAFLASIRGIALLDGRIVEALLGERMPRRSRASSLDAEAGIIDRVKYWLTDRRTWTSIAYMLTMLPLGIAYFVVAVTIGACALAFMASPVVFLFAWNSGNAHPDAWNWIISILLIPIGAVALLALLHLARGIGGLHGSYAKAMLVGGEGASSRRRPVSTSASFGRGLALLIAAVALTAIVGGGGAALARTSSEVVTKQASADDVEVLQIEAHGADLEIVEDPALEDGQVRVEARIRIQKDDEIDPDMLRIDETDGTAKVFVMCDVDVWFFGGCDSTVQIHVPMGSDMELVGETSSGDLEIAAAFERIDLRTGSGDIDGKVDVKDVALESGSGDIDVFLTDAAERVSLETGSGDVSVEAPGSWNVDVETGSGDEDIDVPRELDGNRMRIRTGSGDVEVEPGAG